MNLDALFDDLLTSGVTLADPQRIRKLRVLNTVHLVLIMSAPILGLFYFYIGAIILFYVSVMAGLLMASSLLLLRRTKNIPLIGNFVIAILWVLIFFISWNTGGITYEGVLAPSWILKGCLILLAVFLMGYLHGTIWTLVAFLEIGLFVYLYRIRFQFPNMIPYDTAALYHLATFLVGFLVMVLMAFLFETDKEEALAREQVKTQALRESENYLDEVLERSPVPTFVIDRNHRVVQWNSACQRLTGLSAGDAVGKALWEGFTVGSGKSVADLVLENPAAIEEKSSGKILSRSENGAFEMELFLPHLKGGKTARVTAAPLVDEGGVIRGAIQTVEEAGVPVDTDLIRQRSAPVSFDEGFASPVFKVNGQGKIVSWNQACEEQFGYSSAQMIGADAAGMVSKRYRPPFEETLGKALAGNTSGHKTWRYEHKEGKPLYVLARVYPIASKDGKGKECAVVNTDVTELVLRLRQAERGAAEAREKLKSVSEEHERLKRNIAIYIRGKDESETG